MRLKAPLRFAPASTNHTARVRFGYSRIYTAASVAADYAHGQVTAMREQAVAAPVLLPVQRSTAQRMKSICVANVAPPRAIGDFIASGSRIHHR